MTKRLPPLNPLRSFEAVARHGSLTRAATELNVTHGAISHQIKVLEASLGVELFKRAGHRLRLSPHGADLLPVISQAFENIAAATARMTRPAKSGTLSVACKAALMSFWLLPRLGRFTARFPEIRLTLRASNDAEPFRSPDVDVSILYGNGSWTDCWVKRWSHLELFPIMSPTLMNRRPVRTIRDLGHHTILHADDGLEWHTWLAAVDALDLQHGPQHHLSDARLSIETAMHGHGVALGDQITAASLLANGRLVAPLALAVPAADSLYVACRNELRSAPIVNLFIEWLFAQLEGDSSAAPITATRRPRRESRVNQPKRHKGKQKRKA